jgi:uncharacterized membrane protein YccC
VVSLIIGLTGLLLFIAAAALVYVGIQTNQHAFNAISARVSAPVWDARNAAVGNTLSVGNFLLGASLGIAAATIVWLIIFAVTWRLRSKHG